MKEKSRAKAAPAKEKNPVKEVPAKADLATENGSPRAAPAKVDPAMAGRVKEDRVKEDRVKVVPVRAALAKPDVPDRTPVKSLSLSFPMASAWAIASSRTKNSAANS